MNTLRVALDGPAGAGKSTVAKRVAAALGVAYVDTGAMYRAITWKALQREIPLHDEAALTDLANSIRIDFKPRPEGQAVFVDGVEVTDAIRTLEVTNNVSAVSAVAGVRIAMVNLQRDIASRTGVLMDGRDIGTVVLPNADVKIWLTASVEARANRRYQELLGKGVQCDLQQIQDDIQRRDEYDASREHSPMVKAEDAVVVDTTGMSVDEVIAKIQSICTSAQAQKS
ncbi:(d)CMP kinase [Tumebacillus flagellatus]|uniref:Cytidylate kinase n=1 Tax=Tumebacillus flagellatus TaxID=1157490 RepID=A0A074LUS4_9BACL|nr:(d)CMP kinase [Tumebacillus flagellatus]KEO83663.1 cytidylate kinase [Tumebacillus flagellatus]